MSVIKGFKIYGQRAVAAMHKEYKQLCDKIVFGEINPDILSQQ